MMMQIVDIDICETNSFNLHDHDYWHWMVSPVLTLDHKHYTLLRVVGAYNNYVFLHRGTITFYTQDETVHITKL